MTFDASIVAQKPRGRASRFCFLSASLCSLIHRPTFFAGMISRGCFVSQKSSAVQSLDAIKAKPNMYLPVPGKIGHEVDS